MKGVLKFFCIIASRGETLIVVEELKRCIGSKGELLVVGY